MILQVITDTERRGAQVFAIDLEIALRAQGRNVRTVALSPALPGDSFDVPVLGRTRTGQATLVALGTAVRSTLQTS